LDKGSGIVARVGEQTITVDDLERELAAQREGGAVSVVAPARRRAVLDDLIRREVLAQNARAAGYAEHPEVVATVERALVAQFRDEQMEARLVAVAVSDPEIEAYYRAHRADYTTPERVRAALIWISVPPRATDAKRRELREKAEAASAEAASGEDFGALAVRYSHDQASRYRGGDTGWLVRGPEERWDPQVMDAVFALRDPGDVSPLVTTPLGFAVAKLIERRPQETRPLEAGRRHIYERLLKQKRRDAYEAFLAEMERNVEVEVDEQLLGSLPAPAPLAGGPSLPQPPALPEG